MKNYDIRALDKIRLSGRFDPEQTGFPMMWSGSGAEMIVSATVLEVEISCKYQSHKPYLSFEVDGLRAQTFSPIPGKHWYNVFLNLDGSKKHHVRIIKETQPFGNDAAAVLTLLRLRTDGTFHQLPVAKRRIEFIGDSVTSGEGGRGPVSFMEWVPMCFCASDNYTRMTADALKAEYQVVSQSGWGVYCGWDNHPDSNLPRIYDQICGPVNAQGAEKSYDFSFNPDTVVIALGANDHNAMKGEPYTDPQSGNVYKLSDNDEGRQKYEDACLSFLQHLHKINPGARLVWVSYFTKGTVADCIQKAIDRMRASGVEVDYIVPFDFENYGRGGMGSRSHPGLMSHKRIAKALIQLLK